jgi:hypothetical protein
MVGPNAHGGGRSHKAGPAAWIAMQKGHSGRLFEAIVLGDDG